MPEDQKRPLISFNDNGVTLYPQPIVVIDESLPDAFYPDGKPLEKFRQLNEDEMALFSITDAMVESGMGSLIPINEEFYLNQKQISDLKERVFEFNRILNSLAQKYPDRITLVDIASPVKKIADTGKYDSWGFVVSEEIVYFEGVPLEGGLDLNSIFSLDGIHFNQRGNAFIANAFI
ncbi:MAG: SGNH/GDSL hydrolase family protein, partial [Anaerolineales bacterium]